MLVFFTLYRVPPTSASASGGRRRDDATAITAVSWCQAPSAGAGEPRELARAPTPEARRSGRTQPAQLPASTRTARGRPERRGTGGGEASPTIARKLLHRHNAGRATIAARTGLSST